MSTDMQASPSANLHLRLHFLRITLSVAALANALVPALFFSETHVFGQTDPHDRVLLASFVLIVYTISLLILHLHADVGFAGGYVVGTASVVTLGSIGLALLVAYLGTWDWNSLRTEILGTAGIVFAVLSNVVFLSAGIRYARTIHPRLHPRGFLLGIAASVALLLLCARILL